jgi:hypothetical protein
MSTKIFLPMIGRDYCVTDSEQHDLARKHGVELAEVRRLLVDMAQTVEPQKTATKTKRQIDSVLKAVMLSSQGA